MALVLPGEPMYLFDKSTNKISQNWGFYVTCRRLNNHCRSKFAWIDLMSRGNEFSQQRVITLLRQNWIHTLLERRDGPQSNK